MLDVVIKENKEHESRIMRVIACLYLNKTLTKDYAIRFINGFNGGYSDMEWHPEKNAIRIRSSIPSYVLPWKVSTKENNKLYETVVNNFKPLLKLGKVDIVEDRMPLEVIKYELK